MYEKEPWYNNFRYIDKPRYNDDNLVDQAWGGYSLYLGDRDDRHFLGVVIGDLVFFKRYSSKIL